MAKLEASSDIDPLLYESPPISLVNLLISAAASTLFLRE